MSLYTVDVILRVTVEANTPNVAVRRAKSTVGVDWLADLETTRVELVSAELLPASTGAGQ